MIKFAVHQSDPEPHLNVLIMKDHLAARSFRVPFSWLSRLGIILGAALTALVVLLYLSLKFYRLAERTDPSRVADMERRMAELEVAYREALQKQQSGAETSGVVVQGFESVKPIDGTFTFSSLPSRIGSKPLGKDITIKVEEISTFWLGKRLIVRFDIIYNRVDGGNQQGRILVFGRGKSSLFGYPNRVLNPAGSHILVNPDRGEYFSVSRFRKTEAALGPVADRSQIEEVEVLIIGKLGEILYYKKVPAQGDRPMAPFESNSQ